MANVSALKRIASALDAHRHARDPMERLKASRLLREAAEELELAAVHAARKSGATWRDIGGYYDLSKQGAQQRFGSAPGGSAPPEPRQRKAKRART